MTLLLVVVIAVHIFVWGSAASSGSGISRLNTSRARDPQRPCLCPHNRGCHKAQPNRCPLLLTSALVPLLSPLAYGRPERAPFSSRPQESAVLSTSPAARIAALGSTSFAWRGARNTFSLRGGSRAPPEREFRNNPKGIQEQPQLHKPRGGEAGSPRPTPPPGLLRGRTRRTKPSCRQLPTSGGAGGEPGHPVPPSPAASPGAAGRRVNAAPSFRRALTSRGAPRPPVCA